ncbi:hypothetical protein DIJ64_09560 [Mycobacterium leprae]|uniref:Uncharacterized protein n=1 Tax=Mycobacterium leprae TaxID=1769 RepID=A0AAD0KVV5_MYCLR|nr:hypothetical protein DIJ64_09560 [Mycobacterium leprae]
MSLRLLPAGGLARIAVFQSWANIAPWNVSILRMVLSVGGIDVLCLVRLIVLSAYDGGHERFICLPGQAMTMLLKNDPSDRFDGCQVSFSSGMVQGQMG